jgi:RHS repeat-associated protein
VSRRNAWGNLLAKSVTKCSAENLSLTALANNQLSGYGYDAAGNTTHDATSGLNYSYDQENRIAGAGGFAYTYDDDGNRVEKSNGSTGTLYWYMSPGIVAESDLSGNLQSEYVFFDGERVARKDFPGNAVSYYFSDHLKTTDIVTDAQGTIKNESDFYPWGGELQFLANDSNHYKLTGKERDAETQLDYFGARYYSNGLGRFITPDWAAKATAVPYADFADPQSLNLYSYVRNVPTTRYDADGHIALADDAVVAILVAGTFAVIAVDIYVSQPDNARNLSNALSGAASRIGSFFHRSDNKSSNTGQEQGRDAQGKFLPKQAGQTQPGADAEKAALKAEEATKTGTTLPGTTRKVDGTVTETGQKIEVKSGEVVANTGQLVATGEAAKTATGQPLLVVTTNPNVHVTTPAQQNPNLEIRPAKKPEQQ